ncbi:hypothetical protein D3C78_772320 [compost metagenome]
MTDDRLVDRLTAEQQHHGIVVRFQAQLVAMAFEQRQLPFAHHFQAIDLNRAAQYHQGGVATFVQVQIEQLAGIQADVPDIDRGEGARRPLVTVEFTGNQTQAAGLVLQGDARDIAIEEGLVAGLGHFVLGGQVDPQLDHFQGATRLGECLGVVLLVQDPGRRGHPLDIAGADLAAATGGVAVLQFALVDDGYGFETAMRMLTNPSTCGGRGEFSRTGMVEQQERADVFAQVVVGKQRADRKAVAHPVRPWAGVDTDDVFHGASECGVSQNMDKA